MKQFFDKIFPNLHSKIRFFSSTMVTPTVTVREGRLIGAIKELNDGSEYYSFKGINYARAPVGELRFKAPLPAVPWEGIKEVFQHGPVCPQLDLQTGVTLEGSEDCLFLNVYTKSLGSKKKPVMVYIHGGGFTSGSGDSEVYGPEFLLEHDVVIVTINYRLEVLGFLCLDTPEVPGNAGLKDQVAALHWVKHNISQFGGDPDNVTIFGESAGGASVSYHLISPLSQGLFHKAISQSGVCLSDWAIEANPVERAFRVGKLLGKDTKDPDELLKFLQSVPAIDLTSMTYKTQEGDEKYRGLPIHFAPVVEKFNKNAFLNEKPLDVMLSGKFNKVPLMIGFNSNEGLVTVITEIKKLDVRNEKPSYYVPRRIAQQISEDKLKEFGERIKQYYYPKKGLSVEDLESFSVINSDLHFVYDISKFTDFYSEFCKNVFFYKFSIETELNGFKALLGMSEQKGACHADELFYLFNNAMNSDMCKENKDLMKLVKMVTKIWTDFAKTGNPTPDDTLGVKWRPYTDNKEYLIIDKKSSMAKGEYEGCMDFWDKMHEEAGILSPKKSKI